MNHYLQVWKGSLQQECSYKSSVSKAGVTQSAARRDTFDGQGLRRPVRARGTRPRKHFWWREKSDLYLRESTLGCHLELTEGVDNGDQLEALPHSDRNLSCISAVEGGQERTVCCPPSGSFL